MAIIKLLSEGKTFSIDWAEPFTVGCDINAAQGEKYPAGELSNHRYYVDGKLRDSDTGKQVNNHDITVEICTGYYHNASNGKPKGWYRHIEVMLDSREKNETGEIVSSQCVQCGLHLYVPATELQTFADCLREAQRLLDERIKTNGYIYYIGGVAMERIESSPGCFRWIEA